MDLYNLVVSAKLTKGGGGGDIDVDELSVTENGTYTASSGHAYSPVTVNVPNSYSASDEGKVVSNGALVGQTSATKTANGTYDTTLNNEVVVNVPSVTPTGNINITSTAQTDVSAYATAQVVDADLVAGNIKKDVDILGVVGTYEGGGGGSALLEGIINGTLEEMVIPDGITSIRIGFYDGNTTLESLVIPNSVQTIADRAFRNNSSLASVDIGTGITSMGQYCFYGLPSGANLTIRATTPPTVTPNYMFSSNAPNIFVPAGSVDAYKAASGWSSYKSKIQAIPE